MVYPVDDFPDFVYVIHGNVHAQTPLPPLLGWLLQFRQHSGIQYSAFGAIPYFHGSTAGGVNGTRITSSSLLPSHRQSHFVHRLTGIGGLVAICKSSISAPHFGHVSIILIVAVLLVRIADRNVIGNLRTAIRAVAFVDNPLAVQSVIRIVIVAVPDHRSATAMKTLIHSRQPPCPPAVLIASHQPAHEQYRQSPDEQSSRAIHRHCRKISMTSNA